MEDNAGGRGGRGVLKTHEDSGSSRTYSSPLPTPGGPRTKPRLLSEHARPHTRHARLQPCLLAQQATGQSTGVPFTVTLPGWCSGCSLPGGPSSPLPVTGHDWMAHPRSAACSVKCTRTLQFPPCFPRAACRAGRSPKDRNLNPSSDTSLDLPKLHGLSYVNVNNYVFLAGLLENQTPYIVPDMW